MLPISVAMFLESFADFGDDFFWALPCLLSIMNMVHGLEDWDFFIALLYGCNKEQVIKINKPLYSYRVNTSGRRMTVAANGRQKDMLDCMVYNNFFIYPSFLTSNAFVIMHSPYCTHYGVFSNTITISICNASLILYAVEASNRYSLYINIKISTNVFSRESIQLPTLIISL